MRKIVKHYFIPHEGNDYKPHFFHRRTIGVISLFAAVVFTLSLGYSAILSHIDYLTAVLPSVLIDLANSDRSIYKLTPLTRNATLEVAAKEKANDMARYSDFARPSVQYTQYQFYRNRYRHCRGYVPRPTYYICCSNVRQTHPNCAATTYAYCQCEGARSKSNFTNRA